MLLYTDRNLNISDSFIYFITVNDMMNKAYSSDCYSSVISQLIEKPKYLRNQKIEVFELKGEPSG